MAFHLIRRDEFDELETHQSSSSKIKPGNIYVHVSQQGLDILMQDSLKPRLEDQCQATASAAELELLRQ